MMCHTYKMLLDERASRNKSKSNVNKLGYYDWVFGIAFGTASIGYVSYHSISDWFKNSVEEEPPSCLYICENNDYDNAIFQGWGYFTKDVEESPNNMYIDNLSDTVKHLFQTQPDGRKPLRSAKDRLYKRAIIRYFKELIQRITTDEHIADTSRIRFVVTYPSEWALALVNYLRILFQTACMGDEDDHPDRLLMYSEGESIIHLLQTSYYGLNFNLKRGYKYLIFDMKGTESTMSMYDIDEENNIKVGRRCDWDINYRKESSQLCIGYQDLRRGCVSYLISKLSACLDLVTLQDIIEQDVQLRRDFNALTNIIMKEVLQKLSKAAIESNTPFKYTLPSSLQPALSHPFDSNMKGHSSKAKRTQRGEVSVESMIEKEDTTEIVIYPAEIEVSVFRPIFKLISNYFENIIGGVKNFVETVILVGELCRSVYLMELLEDISNREGITFYPFSNEKWGYGDFDISLRGALEKSVATLKGNECIPNIDLTGIDLPRDTQRDDLREAFFFVDYTSKNTKISYCHTQPGQTPDGANIKRMSDWPGQSPVDEVLPTLELMLIPGNNVKGSTGKKIISLKENNDHRVHFLDLIQKGKNGSIYYTFKKCKRDIIWFTHQLEMSRDEPNGYLPDNVEEFQNNLNPCVIESSRTSSATNKTSSALHKDLSNRRDNASHKFTVTQQHISFKEFSIMFFEYLISFIFDHINFKMGIEGVKFRYCITRDSKRESEEFKLTDDDIRDIASRCGILSEEIDGSQHTLFTLERTEATALYCRDLIGAIDTSNLSENIGFVQLQLTANQRLILLNRIPFYNGGEIDLQVEKSWKFVHRFAKSKNSQFNFMNITCQNLWTHVQNCQENLLQMCGRHSASKRFFNANNMQIFNELLLAYFSKSNLELLNGEKVHDLSICRENDYCRVHMANTDLVQFGFIPSISKLVSEIQRSVSDPQFHQGLRINSLLIMGFSKLCQLQEDDYKVLEDILLMDLKKMSFTSSNDPKFYHQINITQIIKVDEKRLGDNVKGQNCLSNIVLKGSFMYVMNSDTRLLERFFAKSYAIKLELKDLEWEILNGKSTKSDGIGYTGSDDRNSGEPLHASTTPHVISNHLDSQTKISDNMLIPIIRKGTALASLELIEGDVNASFKIFNRQEYVRGTIELYMLEEDIGFDWKPATPHHSRYMLSYFYTDPCNPTYPIIFKARLSQTGSYSSWIEYNKNDKDEVETFEEQVSLKTTYFRQQNLNKIRH